MVYFCNLVFIYDLSVHYIASLTFLTMHAVTDAFISKKLHCSIKLPSETLNLTGVLLIPNRGKCLRKGYF